MAYESRIFIVTKSNYIEDNGKRFGQIVAAFNLGHNSFLSDKMRSAPATDCFIFADDGDTMITEDEYGYPLTEATPREMIDILEHGLAYNGDFRVCPLIAALKAIEEHGSQWKNVAVLHCGY